MIDRKDWREQVRENIAAAVSEISRNGADTILAGGRKINYATITVRVGMNEAPDVEYDVSVCPEDHGKQPPVF